MYVKTTKLITNNVLELIISRTKKPVKASNNYQVTKDEQLVNPPTFYFHKKREFY